MKTLLDVLTQYAEEKLIPRLLRENTQQMRAARLRADETVKRLLALGPEAKEEVEKLETELDRLHFFREQAFLLAGISIGLELGRL